MKNENINIDETLNLLESDRISLNAEFDDIILNKMKSSKPRSSNSVKLIYSSIALLIIFSSITILKTFEKTEDISDDKYRSEYLQILAKSYKTTNYYN
jgi:hypothetical protein